MVVLLPAASPREAELRRGLLALLASPRLAGGGGRALDIRS